MIAVTVKGLDLAVFAVKTDTSTPKTSALEQSAKSFILASAASESSNVAREHYDRNPSLLSKMHISRDGDRAGKPTRESHVQAIGSAADTTPTQCELISISEDDDLAEVGLGMKILMLSVGIAGLTTFVGIGTLFFEGTQILPFESSDFVVKDTSILAGEGRGLTMDGPNEERKQHYATPNTSGPFTEHEL